MVLHPPPARAVASAAADLAVDAAVAVAVVASLGTATTAACRGAGGTRTTLAADGEAAARHLAAAVVATPAATPSRRTPCTMTSTAAPPWRTALARRGRTRRTQRRCRTRTRRKTARRPGLGTRPQGTRTGASAHTVLWPSAASLLRLPVMPALLLLLLLVRLVQRPDTQPRKRVTPPLAWRVPHRRPATPVWRAHPAWASPGWPTPARCPAWQPPRS